MPQIGTYKRVKPRVRVLRGFNPQEPFTLSQGAPVASGVTILSGQVISLAWNAAASQYEWVLGVPAAAVGATPYISLNDSIDYDVVEAGKLPGLSSAGQFEIQTPHFKSADANGFVVDAPVTYDGATGNIKLWKSADGVAGVPVMGFVTRNHGPATLSSVGDGSPATGGNNGVDSSALSPITVVTFTTNYQTRATEVPVGTFGS